MLTKWFGTRSSRPPQRDRFFRPRLEYLEGRLAPSSMMPMDHGGDHGHGNGNGHGNGGDHGGGNGNGNSGNGNGNGSGNGSGNGTGNLNQTGNVHNNIHITGSFNNNTGSFNNLSTVAGSGLLGPGQVGSIGVMFALSSLIAAETGNSSLGTLIDDSVALAVDKYLLLPVNAPALSASGVTGLDQDVTNLNNAIGTLESGLPFIGPVLGDLTFDLTFNALTAAQPSVIPPPPTT